jgi:DNA ligase D-like protein (predicted 3'-phosphoesterase)
MGLSKRRSGMSGQGQRFVIQQHAAGHDYYNFGLEIDGVLVSWAIRPGPSTNPSESGMARRTEDHPLESAAFEGAMADGDDGAGDVLVWDRGTYANRTAHEMSICLGRGHLAFRLDGEKLCGGYGLTRVREGAEETWLLLKRSDEEADARRSPARGQAASLPFGRAADESP